MSTATSVPETYELEGDDAVATLRSTGWVQLAKDSFVRFRAADGTSHSRSLAFQVMLTLLPFVIAVVGLATALHVDQLRQLLTQTVDRLAPGPAGELFTQAIRQGARSATRGGLAALLLGAVAALASATVAMGQIERGANRLYGIEQDRPTGQKYLNGFKLACTAGVLTVAAFLIIVGGTDVARATGLSGVVKGLWMVLRWPLSISFVILAFALLFRAAPRRQQPSWSWLAVGSGVSVLLWFIFTGALAFYLDISSGTFGRTYGPLTGIIAILIWTFLTSLAIYLGLALAAQLEAVRAGVPAPTTGQRENPEGGARSRRGRRPAWR
ncbi:MAG TPA: YihY/virulence factor BrkB family protein [Actinomycetes bacterium]|nr:YihY/virulence factor BrkB family protein [Actinomycetes bacterium]